MSITMYEIAALAKVSQTSVSFVLAGKGAGRIAKSKQELILRLAREHNYRPNASARALRSKKQYTIGIIMPTPRNSFYAEMVSLIQTRLAARGYMALFSFWQLQEEIASVYDAVFQHEVDGIIAWDFHECLINEKIPAVIYADKCPGFDAVMLDFDRQSAEALDYLRQLGHRDIGYLGIADSDRHRSFCNGMAAHQLTVRPEWQAECIGSVDAGAEAMLALLRRPSRPTALLCHNDAAATGAIHAARQQGLRIPEELSLIGFNNDPNSAYTWPPLTTFDARPGEVADALIELVLTRLDDPGQPERTVSIQPLMIRRNSCAAIHNQSRQE